MIQRCSQVSYSCMFEISEFFVAFMCKVFLSLFFSRKLIFKTFEHPAGPADQCDKPCRTVDKLISFKCLRVLSCGFMQLLRQSSSITS